MSDQDIFYVLGGALVVAAVILSALGLRAERFPGQKGIQLGVTAAVALLVVATGAFAWRAAEDEQAHREAELAEAAETESGEPVGEAESEAEATQAEGDQVATADGAQVFIDAGCGGCHQLEDAGTMASTGPPLDASLRDKDAAYIETSIIDPNQDIAPDYPPDVMPQTYEQQLEPAELEALVGYLAEATGAKG